MTQTLGISLMTGGYRNQKLPGLCSCVEFTGGIFLSYHTQLCDFMHNWMLLAHFPPLREISFLSGRYFSAWKKKETFLNLYFTSWHLYRRQLGKYRLKKVLQSDIYSRLKIFQAVYRTER